MSDAPERHCTDPGLHEAHPYADEDERVHCPGTSTDSVWYDPYFPPRLRLRTGRKVERTLYEQIGPQPSDHDPIIGLVDSPRQAELIVEAVNAYYARG